MTIELDEIEILALMYFANEGHQDACARKAKMLPGRNGKKPSTYVFNKLAHPDLHYGEQALRKLRMMLHAKGFKVYGS